MIGGPATCKSPVAEYPYRAFISYSHADEKWASWLHRALETYRVPKYLVGERTPVGEVPAKLGKVFRDREELASSSSLGTELTNALEGSACQIVICSPNAAKSHWTNEEILTYKRLGREDRIFCLIVDGEPGSQHGECFPPALNFRMGADGELSDVPAEPIAADARAHGDGKQNALLKLIAGILGVGFDQLKQREAQRRQRRLMAITAAASVGMVITSGLAGYALVQRDLADQERQRAEREAEIARQTTDFMVGLFRVSDPSEALGNSITAREILDEGAARIETELDDQPEIQATLMDTMGTVYTSLGLYTPAASLVSQALERRERLFGSEHPEVLDSRHHLGEVQTLQADFENAETNLREVLDTRRDLFGETSPEVADTLSDLAEVLTRQGAYEDAEDLVVEALSIRREIHAAPHTSIAESLEDLGLNMYDQGNLDAAVAELREAVAMRRDLHGERHPELAESIGNLALALADLGEVGESETLYREALQMQRELYGDAHPEVAEALNNIGLVLWQGGDLAGSESAFQESLDIKRALLGNRHPGVALTMFNIALVRYDRGDADGAIQMMRDSLDMRRDLLGTEHPDVGSSAINLGMWLSETGDYEEAEELLDLGTYIRMQAFGKEHPRVAIAFIVKANLLLATERFDEALSLAQMARRNLLEALPEDSWMVAYASSAEGAALSRLGSFPEAEQLLLSSLENIELVPIPGAAEQHKIRLANLYTGWGNPDEAARYQTAH